MPKYLRIFTWCCNDTATVVVHKVTRIDDTGDRFVEKGDKTMKKNNTTPEPVRE
jgi:hypothetical protein